MAKTPVKVAKSKSVPKITVPKPRKLKRQNYRSFRLQRGISGRPVTGAFKVLKTAVRILVRNWKVFGLLTLLYGVLNILLVQGFSASSNLNEAKSTFDQVFSGNWGSLASGAGLFVYLLGASGNTANATAGAYQAVLTILFSLALIWALRQAHAEQRMSFRDSLYKGMTPLIPFFLVLLMIGLQLVPLVLGAAAFSLVTSSGIAASSVEQLLWGVLFFGLAVLSLYMITSSLFGLYIVTLPGMAPKQALRSARALVKHRRWTVMRRVIFLPIVLVVVAAAVILPLILFVTSVAAWVIVLVGMLILPMVHSYMYALYRELL